MERLIEMSPAWDRRDPDPRKDYGIHGVDMRFVLKGEKGATQFLLYTGWILPETIGVSDIMNYPDQLKRHYEGRGYSPLMPADLGYHSLTPMYESQSSYDCEYVEGGKCYYDGSSLNAYGVFESLLREGSEGVWRELEDYYTSLWES